MARLLRTQPPQPKFFSQKLPPPVVTTVQVNLASGLWTNQRRAQQRFPRQGFVSGPSSIGSTFVSDTSNANVAGGIGDSTRQLVGQKFVAQTGLLVSVVLKRADKVGAPADALTLSVYNNAGGVPGSSIGQSRTTIPGSSLSGADVVFDLTNVPLTPGGDYWLVLGRTGATDDSNFYSFDASSARPRDLNYNGSVWAGTSSTNFSRVATFAAASAPLISRRGVGLTPPTVTGLPPTPPIKVNLATGLTNQLRAQQRRAMGWIGSMALTQGVDVVGNPNILAASLALGVSGGQQQKLTQPLPARASGGTVVSVTLSLNKAGAPTDNLVVSIQAGTASTPNGVKLDSVTVPASSLTTTLTNYTFALSAQIPAGTAFYHVVLERDGALDNTNFYGVSGANGNGRRGFNGASWALFSPDGGMFIVATVLSPGAPGAFAQAQPFVGVHAPFVNGPPAVPIQVALATGLLTNQRRAQQRRTTRFISPPILAAAAVVSPPVTVYPATGLFTNQRRAQQRRSSYRLATPVIIAYPAAIESTVQVFTVAVADRVTRTRHSSAYRLGYPVVVQVPAAVETTVVATLARIRPRHVQSDLSQVAAAAATFVAPPLRFTFVRVRPRPTLALTSRLALAQSPAPVETTVAAALVHTRPRQPASQLFPPSTLEPQSVFLAERTIRTALVRTRPRATSKALGEPNVVRVPSVEQREQTITVALVRARPRPTTTLSVAPATLEPYSVELREQTIRVTTARIRPAHTVAALGDPAVLQVFAGPSTPRVRTRPRHTVGVVFAPATLAPAAVALTIRVELVRARPRPRTAFLLPPTLLAAAVTTDQIATTFVRIRPLPTTKAISEPTVLQTFAGPTVIETRIRPRRTRVLLAPPTVVRVPSVEQSEQTIRVALVRTRPRHTAAVLPLVLAPTFAPLDSTVAVALARTRPRQTASVLAPPTALSVFAGPAVRTVSARPRPTSYGFQTPATLEPYSIELQEETVRVRLVQTRPRPTVTVLSAPLVVRTPSVEQQEQTIRVSLATLRAAQRRQTTTSLTSVQYEATSKITVALVRTRPRRTTHALTAVSYPAASQIKVVLVRTRPRPTDHALFAPTALQVFAGAAVQTVTTRPRPTTVLAIAPATLEPYSVELREQTIRVALAPARRGRPTSRLTSISYPATSEILVALTRARPRPTAATLTAVSYPATSEITVALVRVRPAPKAARVNPPTVYAPVDTTVAVTLARTRPRPTAHRFVAPSTLEPYSVELREQTIRVALAPARRPATMALLTAVSYPQTGTVAVHLVRTRPRPTTMALTAVTYPATSSIRVVLTRIRPRPTRVKLTAVSYSATSEILVALARTRPRPTTRALYRPTTLQVFAGPAAHLVRSRPRPTVWHVDPPATLEPYAVELAEETIRVRLVQTRPRPTVKTVGEPTVLQTFVAPIRALARIRPRPVRSAIQPGIINSLPSQRVQYAQTALVRTRPRATTSFLLQPTVVIVPSVEQQEETIRVSVVRTRPRLTSHLLTAISYPQTSEVTVTVVRTRPRPTTTFIVPPSLVAAPYPVVTTLTVKCVSTRPRPVRSILSRPTVLQVFAAAKAPLVRTRPRPRTAFLRPPTVVTYPPVETTVSVTLVRARPQTSRSSLQPPTALRTFAGPQAHLAPSRRPRTRSALLALPPTHPERVVVETDLRVNLVARRLDAAASSRLAPPAALAPTVTRLRVVLTRVRPRPTTALLLGFTVPVRPAIEQTISVTLVRARPQATVAAIAPPTRLRPPETTVRTHLVRRVARPGVAVLQPPTVVAPAFIPPPLTTSLAPRGRRSTHSFLAPPPTLVVVPPQPPVVTELTVWLTALEQRLLHHPVRHFYTRALVTHRVRHGFASGSTVPAWAAEGGATGSAAAEGVDKAGSAAEGGSVARHGATIRDVPAAKAEGEDERSS